MVLLSEMQKKILRQVLQFPLVIYHWTISNVLGGPKGRTVKCDRVILPVLSSSHFLISWYSLGEVEQLEIDLAKSKASEEEIRFKYREADIKLNALQDYFKNMESDLHRYAELYFLLL